MVGVRDYCTWPIHMNHARLCLRSYVPQASRGIGGYLDAAFSEASSVPKDARCNGWFEQCLLFYFRTRLKRSH